MNNQIPPFESEAERVAYAEKKASEWVSTLPPDVVEQCGEVNLISDEIRRLLIQLPESQELRNKTLSDG